MLKMIELFFGITKRFWKTGKDQSPQCKSAAQLERSRIEGVLMPSCEEVVLGTIQKTSFGILRLQISRKMCYKKKMVDIHRGHLGFKNGGYPALYIDSWTHRDSETFWLGRIMFLLCDMGLSMSLRNWQYSNDIYRAWGVMTSWTFYVEI